MNERTPTSSRRTGTAGRARRAVLAALLAGTSVLVSSTIAAAEPAESTFASAPGTVPGTPTMQTDEVTLGGPSGQEVPAPGTAASRRAPTDASAPVPSGWTTSAQLLPGTQMVALSWDGDASGPDGPASARLALRSQAADGTWSDWLPVAPDPNDQGGEGAGRVGSEVVWLGEQGAVAVEVRVDAGPIHGLELLRMRYQEGEPVPAPADATASRAATAKPTIRPRSDWATKGWATQNSGCGSGPSVASSLKYAVVHHTASTNSYTQGAVPALIRGIYEYHTSSLGWCDIAYNFVVDKYGGIWQGRSGDISKPVIGGHAKGFNTSSVGVTLLGQFEPGASPASAQPTSAMLDSTARLLAWKLSLSGLDPKGTVRVTSGGSSRYPAGTSVTLPIISYHQQSSTTSCPGANVIAKMGALRDQVVRYTGSTPTTPPPTEPGPTDPDPTRWAPFPDVQTLVYRQYVDFLRNPGTYDARLWWHTNLANGNNSRNQLITSLLSSPELQDRSASSVRLYFAYFNRAPDHSGLQYWWQWIDDGKGIRTESAAFARSPEFTQRYGSLSDPDFVRLVYRNVMGREPDPDGYAFWTGRLRSRSESRGGMMVLFSESGEYKAKTQARTEVVITHEAMLGRAISTQNLREWELRVIAERTSLINQLFASSEYAARFS